MTGSKESLTSEASLLSLRSILRRVGVIRHRLSIRASVLRRTVLAACDNRNEERRAYASVEWEVRECAVTQKPVLVLRDAVADLERSVDLRGCALEGLYLVELRDGHGVSHPVEELLVGDDPDYEARISEM